MWKGATHADRGEGGGQELEVQMPSQRLKASGILDAAELEKLERLYPNLNPIWLKRQMEAHRNSYGSTRSTQGMSHSSSY